MARKLPPSSDPTNLSCLTRRREVRSRDMYMAATAAASSRLRADLQCVNICAVPRTPPPRKRRAGCCAGRTQRLRGAQPPDSATCLVLLTRPTCSTAPGIDTRRVERCRAHNPAMGRARARRGSGLSSAHVAPTLHTQTRGSGSGVDSRGVGRAGPVGCGGGTRGLSGDRRVHTDSA
jgi:hypothetical protein